MFSFSLDFGRLSLDMLPPHRRKTKWKDLLYVLTMPVKTIFDKFAGGSGLIETMRDRVSFTGQVIYLEYLLRRQFCGGAELIHIKDGTNITKTFIGLKNEPKVTYLTLKSESVPGLAKTFMFTTKEFGSNADFVVEVNSTVEFNKAEMQALINYYRPAGKMYEIKIV